MTGRMIRPCITFSIRHHPGQDVRVPVDSIGEGAIVIHYNITHSTHDDTHN